MERGDERAGEGEDRGQVGLQAVQVCQLIELDVAAAVASEGQSYGHGNSLRSNSSRDITMAWGSVVGAPRCFQGNRMTEIWNGLAPIARAFRCPAGPHFASCCRRGSYRFL